MAGKSKEDLERDVKVVRNLMGPKMGLDQIEQEHPQLAEAVGVVREEKAAEQKTTKSTGSGCCMVGSPRKGIGHI